MPSIVDAVADFIEGSLNGWVVSRAYEPPTPNRTVTLIEYPGEPPETTFAMDYPSFQVRVRSDPWAYEEARDEAETLYRLLHAATIAADVGVSPIGTVTIVAQQQPFPVDRDELDRDVIAFNCRSMRTL